MFAESRQGIIHWLSDSVFGSRVWSLKSFPGRLISRMARKSCAARHVELRGVDGKTIDTPQLDVAYAAQDFRAMREMGATWKLINDQTREPNGIEPVAIP